MARLNYPVLVVCSLSLLLFPACKRKSKSATTDNAVAQTAQAKVKKSEAPTDEALLANDAEAGKKDAKAWGGAPKQDAKSPPAPRSIEELKKLRKPIPTTEKQAAARKQAKRGLKKAEKELDKAVSGGSRGGAEKGKSNADGNGQVERVAPSGTFPETAHNLYETLCQEIESVDRLISEYRKSKSKKIYIKAKMAVTECLMSARGIADEYEGYPGIDDRIADLEKKEQTLAAEKP